MKLATILLVGGICVTAVADAQTIYRCKESAGGVLYSDTPCTGGRVVEMPEFRSDPAARERLQREIDAFDKRQAARDALARQRENEADARRRADAEAARRAQEREAAQDQAPYGYYGYGWYPPYYARHDPPPLPRPRPIRPGGGSYIPLR